MLAACRGLGDAGYRVTAVSDERYPISHWSRLVHERAVLAGPCREPHRYAQRLARLLEERPHDVVLPGTDPALVAISEGRDHLEGHAVLGLPPHETVRKSLDRLELIVAATAADLPPPNSIVCRTLPEATEAAASLGYPLVAKPASTWSWAHGYPRQRAPLVVADETGLTTAASTLGWPLTLQEHLGAAPIMSAAGVYVDDRVLGFTFARYERAYPRPAAKAAFAITLRPPADLRERVEELLRHLGWIGMFELELLEREGRLHAIDFNPRPFGWLALPIAAGANLPAIWCDYLLNRRMPAPAEARPGLRFRREDTELRAALELAGHGRLTAAAAILRPRRHVVHAYFRRDDPLPAVAGMLSLAHYHRLYRSGERRRRDRPPAPAARGDLPPPAGETQVVEGGSTCPSGPDTHGLAWSAPTSGPCASKRSTPA